jgi:beta-N-acetylhexosaminidase
VSAELERLATSCLFPGFEGLEAPDWILRELAAGLGGVILFSRNIRDEETTRRLTAGLRAESSNLLIGLDEEGGDVTRLELARGSSYPGANALGAVDDPELTRSVARSLGGDLARVGLDLELAPVADINSDPLNPVIGIRAFGDDPELVARHVVAFTQGLQEVGVAACAKHFPGHGATRVDSHVGLPVVDVDRETLLARELVPFRAAIAAGVQSIMTAHLVVPSIDSEPATLSAAHLTGLMRDELGYDGVVITDALEMGAVADTVGMEESAVRALAAGADALCLGARIDAGHVARLRAAIVTAVHDGRLSEERLHEAAARVARLQEWTSPVASGSGDGVGLVAARRALRASGNVRLARTPFVVELLPEPGFAAGPASHDFAAMLERREPQTRSARLREGDPAESAAAQIGADQLVLVVHDPGRFEWVAASASSILARTADAIVVDVGLPGWSAKLPVAGWLTTRGAGRVNYEAALELLLAA